MVPIQLCPFSLKNENKYENTEHACQRIEECSNMAEDCEGGVADARVHYNFTQI
jgi:hypothetical protein